MDTGVKPDMKLRTLLCSCLFVLSSGVSAAEPNKALAGHLQQLEGIQKASVLIDLGDNDSTAIRADKLLIPASTLKIATALLAAEKWGLGYRFETEFYQQGDTLWVKGLGDPFLTSEEILLIREQLELRLDLTSVKQLKLDNSYFPELRLDGRSASDNPYDAGNAALAINFNTAAVRFRNGQLQAGESQTPLTPLAIELAQQIPAKRQSGKQRVSLPGGRDMSARYFGEVFSQLVFFRQLPMHIAQLDEQPDEQLNEQQKGEPVLIYRHQSSKTLEDLIIGMLKYSNNFIANQLFLLLPDQEVSIQAAQQYAMDELRQRFGWESFNVADGAGLSRQNLLTARQLMQVLEAFRPWAYLMPARGDRIQAKTGTFWDNHSYAGYYLDDANQWQGFVLLINTSMKARYRFRFADTLVE